MSAAGQVQLLIGIVILLVGALYAGLIMKINEIKADVAALHTTVITALVASSTAASAAAAAASAAITALQKDKAKP